MSNHDAKRVEAAMERATADMRVILDARTVQETERDRVDRATLADEVTRLESERVAGWDTLQNDYGTDLQSDICNDGQSPEDVTLSEGIQQLGEVAHQWRQERDDLAGEVTRLRACDLLTELREHHIPWSAKTFGEGWRVERICRHIERELAEIRARPTDVTEWMDVVILALDGAWRAGYEAEEVLSALLGKMKIIRGREYPTPTDDDEPCEHIKSPNPGGES